MESDVMTQEDRKIRKVSINKQTTARGVRSLQ
jgi:hypothetical protein